MKTWKKKGKGLLQSEGSILFLEFFLSLRIQAQVILRLKVGRCFGGRISTRFSAQLCNSQ